MSEQTLEEIVKEYIAEMANPSPCHIMRQQLRERMAKAVGVEPPHVTRRRWESGQHRSKTDDK